MRIILAVVFISIVAVACGSVVHAAEGTRITLISRSQDTVGLHIAYLVEAATPVAITVANGSARISATTDGAGWRATVTGILAACGGVLVVDGREVVRLRCVWLPVEGRR